MNRRILVSAYRIQASLWAVQIVPKIMTVVYTNEVATGRALFFGNFFRLLFRWRGSIYKVVLVDCVVYGLMYAVISLMYRFWMKTDPNPNYKKNFELIVKYCGDYAGLIPVSFVLGFYVAQIVTRWWNQFLTIPWPDILAATVASSLHGDDDRSRMMKRAIMRYTNCTFVMCLVGMSPQVKARFPSMDHIVEAGLLLPHERMLYDHLDANTDYPKYWLPCIWACNIAARARLENRIDHDTSFVNIINLILRFRSGCGDLMAYDWVCIPLVYTQVVTLAVHLYFLAALFGKQFIDDEHEIDLYVPVFLFLEFFFYMGWLKVAETMVNPFGEDDDDFEVNWLIDRNFSISLLIIEMGGDFPQLSKDIYWDIGVPDGLPYTKASEKYRTETHLGSAYLQDVDVGNFMEPETDTRKDPRAGMQSLFSSNRGAGARRSRSETALPVRFGDERLEIGIDLDPAVIQANIDQDRNPLAHLMEPMTTLLKDRRYRTHPAGEINEKAKQEKEKEIPVTKTVSNPPTGIEVMSRAELVDRAADLAKKYNMKKP